MEPSPTLFSRHWIGGGGQKCRSNNNQDQRLKGRTTTTTTIKQDHYDHDQCDKDKKNNPYLDLSPTVLFLVSILRGVALIMWAGGIGYATYKLFTFQEGIDELAFSRDPNINEGLFSTILGRGKDTLDAEWRVFAGLLWTLVLPFVISYFVGVKACQALGLNNVTRIVSPALTIILLYSKIGFLPLLHFVSVTVLYWGIMKLRSTWTLWCFTVCLIFHICSAWVEDFFPMESYDGQVSYYIFGIVSAWNFSRGVSFCMDSWTRQKEQASHEGYFSSLLRLFQYSFYLPFILTGPLVTFDHFEEQVINKQNCSSHKGDIVLLGKTLFKLVLFSVLMELIFHFLYYRLMSYSDYTYFIIPRMNMWALCGIIYWIGQGFALKYKVLYGVSTVLAEFDGMSMYSLPCCPSYIHRYSVLWKDFDRGLYIFLVKYIYAPFVNKLNSLDSKNKVHIEVKKLLASALTFSYVFLWHNISYDVFIWSALNFLGITIEKAGTLIKQLIESRKKLHPLVWDVLVEPLVTVPLAAMSILGSTVFCGTLEASGVFYAKLSHTWNAKYYYHAVICLFLYCFTHVGVTVRTWIMFSEAVSSKLSMHKMKKK